MTLRRLSVILLTSGLTLRLGTAYAEGAVKPDASTSDAAKPDTVNPDAADQLFNEGVQLMEAGRCEDAIPRFMESQKLDPSAATLLNIATCHAQLGRTATAWRMYQRAAAAAVLEKNEELRALADKGSSVLDPRLIRLRVVAASAPDSITIKVNGEPVEGQNHIPLDPGENFIEATAPGRNPWHRVVSAQGPGALIVVEVPDLAPAGGAESTSARAQLRSEAGPPHLPNPRMDQRPIAGVVFGIGATALTIGTITAFRAQSAYNDSKDYCPQNQCNSTGTTLRETAFDRADLATWAVGVGVAAVAAGTVLWITSGHPRKPAPMAVLPWTGSGFSSYGLSMKGEL